MTGYGKTGLVLTEPILHELSSKGNKGIDLPVSGTKDYTQDSQIPNSLLREDISDFPELSEPEIVRHFTRLSTYNYSLDGGFYPLGSCTMKYNPKLNEVVSQFEGFAQAHPLTEDEDSQGILRLLYELQEDLTEISGMDTVCLHPSAGSHGELLGMMLICAYHESRKDFNRKKVLIPDSAHGTNPSSAAICDLQTVTVKSGPDGQIDLTALNELMDEDIAGIMITNPNCCGLFESRFEQICEIVHQKGGLVYFDGANLNALVGMARPGDMGADVLHFNTHKTFSTPHGGGGPGAGPIALKKILEPFLPKPVLVKKNDFFHWDYNRSESIGRVRSFFGNTGVLIRAYCFIKTLGASGLREMTETAVLNANYIKNKLENHFDVPFKNQNCMHEVLLSDKTLNEKQVTTLNIAKALIDKGFHPPTIYFPLIVHGAMLIEPTESESRATLDHFIDTMIDLAEKPVEFFENLPQKSYVSKVDEVKAARTPVLRWEKIRS